MTTITVSKNPETQDEKIFYNKKDLSLFKFNYIKMVLLQADPTGIIYRKNPIFEILTDISYLSQAIAAYKSIPDPAFLEKRLAHPITRLLSLLNPTLRKITAAATALGIIRNSASKLINYFKCDKKDTATTLKGSIIHLFNLACEFLHFIDNFNPPPKTEEPYTYTREAPPKDTPESKYEDMNDIDRLTKAGLQTNYAPHAEQALKINVDPECRSSAMWGDSNLSEACASTCKSIKRAFNKIFLNVHPDTNPNTPGALEASQNLNNFKEKLDEYYKCGKHR